MVGRLFAQFLLNVGKKKKKAQAVGSHGLLSELRGPPAGDLDKALRHSGTPTTGFIASAAQVSKALL